MNDYIYIIVIIICWSLNPFLKKIVNKNITPIEYNLYNNMCVLCIILLVFSRNAFSKNSNLELNMFKKLSAKEIGVLVTSSFLTLLPSYLFVTLIRNHNVSRVNSIIQSSTILVGSLIGIFFFSEPFSIYKLIGVANIIIGIYFIL